MSEDRRHILLSKIHMCFFWVSFSNAMEAWEDNENNKPVFRATFWRASQSLRRCLMVLCRQRTAKTPQQFRLLGRFWWLKILPCSLQEISWEYCVATTATMKSKCRSVGFISIFSWGEALRQMAFDVVHSAIRVMPALLVWRAYSGKNRFFSKVRRFQSVFSQWLRDVPC